jgi:hypothetical protein
VVESKSLIASDAFRNYVISYHYNLICRQQLEDKFLIIFIDVQEATPFSSAFPEVLENHKMPVSFVLSGVPPL